MPNANARPDIEDMIDNPEPYGFRWGYSHLHKKGMQVTVGAGAPHMVHLDVDKIRNTFGDDYILVSTNQQSARVRDQQLREDIWDDKSLASRDRDMKRIVLHRAFGQKRTKATVVEVRIYVADDGEEFRNKAEFLEYQAKLRDSE